MMAFTRQPEWFYDGATEELRDGPGGEVIGKAESASGPLLAAGPELGNILAAVLEAYDNARVECRDKTDAAALSRIVKIASLTLRIHGWTGEYGTPMARMVVCPEEP